MIPLVNDTDFQLYVGDVCDVLRELPAGSVHMCVTSPPYWGLRDYGTGSWAGGDADCDHSKASGPSAAIHKDGHQVPFRTGKAYTDHREEGWGDVCGRCGASRVDKQLGLEPTPDLYVARMVEVFREVRRVLRSDGTCWINLGDSYNAATSAVRKSSQENDVGYWQEGGTMGDGRLNFPGLKPKDLCGLPWRVAFALQADGWWLRSDIIWSKPNPMPESVTDRPTKAHEYLFLLSKSPRYFYDADAIREEAEYGRSQWNGDQWSASKGIRGGYSVRPGQPQAPQEDTLDGSPGEGQRGPDGRRQTHIQGRDGSVQHRDGDRWPKGPNRNRRSVWEIATEPYPEAHFATFPQALVEPCVKAGTSEFGCCPECGAPWEREVGHVKGESAPVRPKDVSIYQHADPNRTTTLGHSNSHDGTVRTGTRIVHGWKPSCACGMATLTQGVLTGDPVPCTVLDPFMGSGTTALVARRLGRRSIGVELNPEYAQMCAKRLQQLSLLAEA